MNYFMEEEELKLLNEIDQLHKKLLSEPTGTFNFALKQVIPPNGYTYVRCAISLRDKVVELCNKFKPDYIEGIEIRQLYHTCGKEVSYVELQQGKVSKPRASQKSKNELIDKMEKASKQIEIDVYSLFKKIDELKETKLLPLQ